MADPELHDIKAFYELVSEEDIQTEFLNFRDFTYEDSKNHIEDWIEINKQRELMFLGLLKLATQNVGETELWDDNNSLLIGFVVNSLGTSDASSRMHNLSFGISKKYRNRGLMTLGLNLATDSMTSRGYNFAAAYVKHHNSASMRVLEKCDFHIESDNLLGLTYIKHLEGF